MALSPEARQLVDTMSAGFPALGTTVVDATEARALRAQRPAAEVEPIAVGRVDEQRIAGPDGALRVRIYRPPTPARAITPPPPLIVFLHGGGWVFCDLDSHDQTVRRIVAATGAVAVSVEYRLAPEHRFPAAAEDAYAALCWAADHSVALGADATRLVVMGDSAGGNLAAAAALMTRDRGGPEVALQALIYPVLDHCFDTDSYRINGHGYFLTIDHMRWFWEQYLGPDGDGGHRYASPARADLRGVAPAFVVVGEHDPLRDEGVAYVRALHAAGVRAQLQVAPGLFHGFFGAADALAEAGAQAGMALAAIHAHIQELALDPKRGAVRYLSRPSPDPNE